MDERSQVVPNPFLTVHEAARIFKICEATLRRLIHEKKLRACRVGPVRLLVRHADLEKFFDDNPVLGPAEVRDGRRRGRRTGRPAIRAPKV